MIQLTKVSKGFAVGKERIEILRDIDLEIKAGEKVAIIGPSGSGKTTLLTLIAGLDTPDAGQIVVAGKDLSTLSPEELAQFRNRTIGIVFQSFELIAPFTVYENVLTPLEIAGVNGRSAVGEALASVGLTGRQDALPQTLSGGEMQRVAIARALIMKPKIVLADEPTGSLDRLTGMRIIDLLVDRVAENKAALVVITHDPRISERMDRVIELHDSALYEQS